MSSIALTSRSAGARLLWLDILRVVAISLVVISHIGGITKQAWSAYVPIGGLYFLSVGNIGVTIFLVLSGASLQYAYGQRHGVWTEFYWRRLQRIYPIYWMALVLDIALWPTLTPYSFSPSVASFMLMATGFCAFVGNWGCHLTTSWFIGLIVSLYALYPVLSSALRRAPHFTLVILFLLSICSRLFLAPLLPLHATEWFPLSRVFELGIGMYLVQQQKVSWMGTWRVSSIVAKCFKFCGELSLPVFLVHWTMLPITVRLGVGPFILSTISISYCLHLFDRKIQSVLFKPRVVQTLLARQL
jgi:peptidoglycan/LPS O-acetylase OafA/YrhL